MLILVASLPSPEAMTFIVGGAVLMVAGIILIYGHRRSNR